MKVSHTLFLLIFIASLFLFVLPAASADRGGFPVMPNISIFETGQKAIIAWNGTDEILILSTDLHTNETTMVLEMLPLPSNPKAIRKASEEPFENAHSIVKSHAPMVYFYPYFSPVPRGGDFETMPSSIKIAFHEKIGTHDIAVVKPQDISEFANWIEIFLKDNNITQEASLQNFETVLRNYIDNGFNYFVLDLIELSTQQKSVEPIFYEFETNSLYYPLQISSLASGDTKITLFLITREYIDELYCFPFRFAYYGSSPSIMNHIVEFTIEKSEIRSIETSISHLFGNSAWLTVLQYSGPNNALKGDVALPVLAFHLSYGTLLLREILFYAIVLLPLEIMIGLPVSLVALIIKWQRIR